MTTNRCIWFVIVPGGNRLHSYTSNGVTEGSTDLGPRWTYGGPPWDCGNRVPYSVLFTSVVPFKRKWTGVPKTGVSNGVQTIHGYYETVGSGETTPVRSGRRGLLSEFVRCNDVEGIERSDTVRDEPFEGFRFSLSFYLNYE